MRFIILLLFLVIFVGCSTISQDTKSLIICNDAVIIGVIPEVIGKNILSIKDPIIYRLEDNNTVRIIPDTTYSPNDCNIIEYNTTTELVMFDCKKSIIVGIKPERDDWDIQGPIYVKYDGYEEFNMTVLWNLDGTNCSSVDLGYT